MAKHFNVTGLLTQELLPPGNGVSVSEVSLTNVGFTSAAKIDLYMEKKLTGKFYLLREVLIPLGATLTHEIIGFNNNIGEFGMYVKLHGSANFVLTGSIDPTASNAVTGVGTDFLREVSVGDEIIVSGETRIVRRVKDTITLTVDSAFSNNANDTSPECSPVSPVDIIFA